MRTLYSRLIHAWEDRLNRRDTNRVVRPFEWGLDWVARWSLVNGDASETTDFFDQLNRSLIARSDEFFSYTPPTDFRLERRKVERLATGNHRRNGAEKDLGMGDFLRFTSPVATPYPENNLANARWFPARGRRAVVVLPNWNADALSHNTLCRIFNLIGIAALRLSMPYHDVRRPPQIERADYAVSSNLGRTLDAARQAVIDTRCCLDWLQSQGYSRFALVGTSLGSCYSFLTAAHEPRVHAVVFNHASTYFADVVWTGATTRHVRAGLEPHIDLDSLRRAWMAISPAAYFDHFARWPRRALVVYGTQDTTFPLDLSMQLLDEFRRRGIDHQAVSLPCGHYTIGETPYKFLDGYHIASFLRASL